MIPSNQKRPKPKTNISFHQESTKARRSIPFHYPNPPIGVRCLRGESFLVGFAPKTLHLELFCVEELRIELDRPVGITPVSVVVQPRNWEDAFAYRLGGNYRCGKGVTIGGGYIFDRTPVPDETFDPTIPDADRHIFTVGGDYRLRSWTLGLAYNCVLGEEREKSNSIGSSILPGDNRANGEFRQASHSLAVRNGRALRHWERTALRAPASRIPPLRLS